MRRLPLIGGAGFVLALVWFLWPVYGFYSNQFESWRLPFGWHAVPDEVPVFSDVLDDDYAVAAEKALAVIEERRAALGLPSLSAAVAVDGQLVWAGGAGVIDVGAGEPVSPDVSYRIGSTSKAVTSTLLARLVQDGTVALDTSIGTYAPDLPNGAWSDFTLRQLASHQTGLPEYETNTDYAGLYRTLSLRGTLEDPCKASRLFDGADLSGAPGENFEYTSFGTVLLGCVLQEAAGQPYADLMQAHVASPLGLTSLTPDHEPAADGHSRPVWYQARRDGETGIRGELQITEVAPWRRVNLSQKLPGGGWTATPSDLARLGAAWLDEEFISTEIREIFHTPVPLADGSANPQGYAIGWRRAEQPIGDLEQVVHVNHGGVSKGSQAWLMIVPEHDLALAVTTNARTDDFFAFAGVYLDLVDVFLADGGVARSE